MLNESVPATSPPTHAGPIPDAPAWVSPTLALSASIHVAAVVLASFITPLAMHSNLWPIAGVFWSALTSLPAALIGATVGAIVRRMPRSIAIGVILVTASAIAAIVAVVILNNR
jgi:hypothetical protein